MKSQKMWGLLVGLLLLVGTLGYVVQAKTVPVPDVAKQSPPGLELGRDAAIAEIERLETVGPAPTGEKITFKLNLKPGDQRKRTIGANVKTNMSAQGRTLQANMSMGFGMTFDVLDVDQAGVHTIKYTYDHVRVKMSGGPMSFTYDSDNPTGQENPMAKSFASMVGISLTMKVTPEGKTLEVTGMEELTDKVSEQVLVVARAITEAVEHMMAFLPKEPVDIRDSWSGTVESTANPNMPMTINITYTLYDRKDGKAIIKTDGKIDSSKGLSGTTTGTMRIDEATGWPEGGEDTVDYSGSISMKGIDVDVKVHGLETIR